MRNYTVTGLLDEQSHELYVAAVQEGRHEPVETSQVTTIPGYGNLTRFAGYFEAGGADEAERIATDVVRHYADDDAPQWAPGSGRGYRRVENVETGEEL